MFECVVDFVQDDQQIHLFPVQVLFEFVYELGAVPADTRDFSVGIQDLKCATEYCCVGFVFLAVDVDRLEINASFLCFGFQLASDVEGQRRLASARKTIDEQVAGCLVLQYRTELDNEIVMLLLPVNELA